MATPGRSHIQFHYLSPVNLTHRSLLKDCIGTLFKRERTQLDELNYIFCSDAYLLDINQNYLQHDDYTDIITFDLSDEPGRVKGEIYISIDRVKENARTFSVPLHQELRRVIFHGALHLCGYKDKSNKDIQAMRTAENKYLSYFLSHLKQ
jgi:probable rRNA maturation factor